MFGSVTITSDESPVHFELFVHFEKLETSQCTFWSCQQKWKKIKKWASCFTNLAEMNFVKTVSSGFDCDVERLMWLVDSFRSFKETWYHQCVPRCVDFSVYQASRSYRETAGRKVVRLKIQVSMRKASAVVHLRKMYFGKLGELLECFRTRFWQRFQLFLQ